jgi:hypothetical protein
MDINDLPDYSQYADRELTDAWNYLETCRESASTIIKSDLISTECGKRGIRAWNEKGEITLKDI